MEPNPKMCSHLKDFTEVKEPTVYVCQECIAVGSHWLHLRTCQTCGEVHCCDSSPNQHATKHFHQTGHPVITSAEPGEYWAWCYPDSVFLPLQ